MEMAGLVNESPATWKVSCHWLPAKRILVLFFLLKGLLESWPLVPQCAQQQILKLLVPTLCRQEPSLKAYFSFPPQLFFTVGLTLVQALEDEMEWQVLDCSYLLSSSDYWNPSEPAAMFGPTFPSRVFFPEASGTPFIIHKGASPAQACL